MFEWIGSTRGRVVDRRTGGGGRVAPLRTRIVVALATGVTVALLAGCGEQGDPVEAFRDFGGTAYWLGPAYGGQPLQDTRLPSRKTGGGLFVGYGEQRCGDLDDVLDTDCGYDVSVLTSPTRRASFRGTKGCWRVERGFPVAACSGNVQYFVVLGRSTVFVTASNALPRARVIAALRDREGRRLVDRRPPRCVPAAPRSVKNLAPAVRC